MFSTGVYSRTTVKKMGDRACQRDMGQSYPIYFCAGTNHAPYFIFHGTFYGSWIFKVVLHGYSKKNLQFPCINTV